MVANNPLFSVSALNDSPEFLKIYDQKESPVLSFGLLFDVAGLYPALVYAKIRERQKSRAKDVRTALQMDMEALGKDMRRAIENWKVNNG